jgi:uncharacterized protein
MSLKPDDPAGRQAIEAYGDGGFRVSGSRYDGSLLVLPDEVVVWPVKEMADLVEPALQSIIERADRIEVLLLGCGPSIAFLKPDLRARLKEHGIAVDLMDSGAACRTYNVLMGENRKVAAALIAI